MGHLNIIGDLVGVYSCPHCSVANPQLKELWASKEPLYRGDVPVIGRLWATYQCTSCSDVVLVKCAWSSRTAANKPWDDKKYDVDTIYPSAKIAHEDVPEPARTFLQQALEHVARARRGCGNGWRSSRRDAQEEGAHRGELLYSRIDKALKDNLLTQGMADWAHNVRLGSNRPRHADEHEPHVVPEQAKQSVEFANRLEIFCSC